MATRTSHKTAGDAVRTYDAGNQELHFVNGSFVLGNSHAPSTKAKSDSQAAGTQAGNGYTETPALYTQIIEAINETGPQSTGIAFSNDGTYNSTTDVLSLFTNGQNRLVAHGNGHVQLNEYGQNIARFPGDAALDKYLTVGIQGYIREVPAPGRHDDFQHRCQPRWAKRSKPSLTKPAISVSICQAWPLP